MGSDLQTHVLLGHLKSKTTKKINLQTKHPKIPD